MPWTIDTELSRHDAVKVGVLSELTSRVLLSEGDFPDPVDARAFAALFSISVHSERAHRIDRLKRPYMATSATYCL